MTHQPLDDANPFATRFTRPGAIPYLFPEGQSAAQLVERLAACGSRAQLVGAHGSGKTTLLLTLIPLLEASGQYVHLIRLQEQQRQLPESVEELAARIAPSQKNVWLVIDGYDQLSFWSRWKLKSQIRRRGWRLLVTTHRMLRGFRLLTTVDTCQDLALRLARRLLKDRVDGAAVITDAQVQACFDAHQGNMRETLFALYDLMESWRRVQSSPSE